MHGESTRQDTIPGLTMRYNGMHTRGKVKARGGKNQEEEGEEEEE